MGLEISIFVDVFPDCRSRRVGYPGRGNIKTRFRYITIHGKKFASTRKVGLQPVGPRKVFYFPPTTHRRQMKASPYPPPGDAPSRGYRLPEGS
ncbi:hypothetical protein CEXT_579731 [Caerostris extrusa]|uniref:Uncharacterized protein n=1 Tax=Caerostris extrusa TaxID=172846 RepID=A0AAV4VKT5_CAEEX|nr:hypothetical protein CEXT_579731 [Caerostris extrusa]